MMTFPTRPTLTFLLSLPLLMTLNAAAFAADDPPAAAVAPTAPVAPGAPAAPTPGTWHTSAELGAISTTGNTVGTSVTGKIDAHQELEVWSNEYIASGYFKKDQTTLADGSTQLETSAENFLISAKAAYKLLRDGAKAYVLASHAGDKFGAYTKYSSISVGHSAEWIKTPDKTLDAEIGPGYYSGKHSDGTSDSGLTVRGAASFKWQVSQNAVFTQTASVERSTVNTHSIAETALSTKINNTMQMKAAFSAHSDTNVPNEKKTTDTQTSLTLVYSF